MKEEREAEEGYKKGVQRRGQCADCEQVHETTIIIEKSTGIAGWTCPNCNNTQEPPIPVEED